jgi:hypothetical protein
VIFSGARDLSEIIFEISGPNYKIMDYGLILEKTRASLKIPGNIDLMN